MKYNTIITTALAALSFTASLVNSAPSNHKTLTSVSHAQAREVLENIKRLDKKISHMDHAVSHWNQSTHQALKFYDNTEDIADDLKEIAKECSNQTELWQTWNGLTTIGEKILAASYDMVDDMEDFLRHLEETPSMHKGPKSKPISPTRPFWVRISENLHEIEEKSNEFWKSCGRMMADEVTRHEMERLGGVMRRALLETAATFVDEEDM